MLLEWILAAMTSLDPNGTHSVLANAIAARVDAEPALFADDVDRKRTAALLVAVAWRESSFRLDAVGDTNRSVCAYQILNGPRSLLTDADACVATGFRMLRASFAACRHLPVNARMSAYARGRCDSADGQRLSRDRMALAARLVRDVVLPAKTAFGLPKAAPSRPGDTDELNGRWGVSVAATPVHAFAFRSGGAS